MSDDAHLRTKLTQKAILFGPDGDVLVCRVGEHHEPPGGTVERGETLVDALRRELREELDVDARVGAPVEAAYGGWVDGDTGEPMLTVLYRCRTDDREVTLNDEHDAAEWVAPDTARERLGDWLGGRGARAVDRAVAIGEEGPFAPLSDAYEGTDLTTGEVLERVEEIRETDVEAFRDR